MPSPVRVPRPGVLLARYARELPDSRAKPYYRAVDDEYRRFAVAYWAVTRELDTVRLRAWEQSKLTLPQLRVLFGLRRAPGRTTGELAREMSISVSTVSGLVIKLEERGLIERGRDAADRRREPLLLTEQGAILTGDIVSEVMRPFVRSVAERLGDDLASTTAALERLGAAATAAREQASELVPSA